MPIVGRVVDLEGRPVPGVTVRPVGLSASPDEDLSDWEAAMARAKDIYDGAMGKLPRSLDCSAGARTRPSRPMPTAGSA